MKKLLKFVGWLMLGWIFAAVLIGVQVMIHPEEALQALEGQMSVLQQIFVFGSVFGGVIWLSYRLTLPVKRWKSRKNP